MKETLRITGMTCHSCEMLIKEEVAELPGVKSINISAKTGKAVVDFDASKVSLHKIKEMIKNEGYGVE